MDVVGGSENRVDGAGGESENRVDVQEEGGCWSGREGLNTEWMLEEGLITGWMELQESLRTDGCCKRV